VDNKDVFGGKRLDNKRSREMRAWGYESRDVALNKNYKISNPNVQ